jgi:hypothetical protein
MADMMNEMKMAHPPVLGVGTEWTRRCAGISKMPHFVPNHLATGVRSREMKKGTMSGAKNSLTIHILYSSGEAEGGIPYLLSSEARIEGEGEGLGEDLFGGIEAIEAEISMEWGKDRALGLNTVLMQLFKDLL